MIYGKSFSLPLANYSSFFLLEAMKGVEPLSSGLQDRRSVIQLSYIAKEFGGLGGSQTLTRSLQDFYAIGYITSPELGFKCTLRLIFGGCGWSRTTNLALMRRLLSPFELHSQEKLRVQALAYQPSKTDQSKD